MMFSCQSITLMRTPRAPQGGNQTLGCSTALRLDYPPIFFFITLNKSPCTLSDVDICFFVLFITLSRVTGVILLQYNRQILKDILGSRAY